MESKRYYTCTREISDNRWTDDGNSSTDSFLLAGGDFEASGDTTSNMGQITSFSLSHIHTASGGDSYQWTLWVVVTFANGNSYESNKVTKACNGTSAEWINNITEIPVATFATGIQSIKLVRNKPASGHSLYVRSSSFWGKIVGTLTFDTYVPQAPTITTAEFRNSITQYMTAPVFRHAETFDASAQSQSKILRLYNYMDYDISYSITSSQDSTLSSIPVHGTVYWKYTVTDTNGKSSSASGSISVNQYYLPEIQSFSAARVGNTANSHVALTVKRGSNSSSNSSKIKKVVINYAAEGASGGNSRTLHSDSEISSFSYNSKTEEAPFTTATGSKYYFDLVVTDTLGLSSSSRVTVNAVGALLNIEKTGVGIGRMVTNSDDSEPKFEVSMPTWFLKDVRFSNRLLTSIDSRESNQVYRVTSYASSFKAASTYPWIIKFGPIVYINGASVVKSTIPSRSGDNVYYAQLFGGTLPTGFRPVQTTHICCTCEGVGLTALMVVNTGGLVIIRNQSSGLSLDPDTTIYYSGMWIANDSIIPD